MVNENGIYKCELCGNIVSVIEAKPPGISCCGEEMVLIKEQTSESEGKEKHVPIIEGRIVKIGSVPHPMEEKHFIQLVQVLKNGKIVSEKRLQPGDETTIEFNEDFDSARAFCNIHGLWINS